MKAGLISCWQRQNVGKCRSNLFYYYLILSTYNKGFREIYKILKLHKSFSNVN